jgi:hypothetical protein
MDRLKSAGDKTARNRATHGHAVLQEEEEKLDRGELNSNAGDVAVVDRDDQNRIGELRYRTNGGLGATRILVSVAIGVGVQLPCEPLRFARRVMHLPMKA